MIALRSRPASDGDATQAAYRKILPSVLVIEVETQAGERFLGSGIVGPRNDLGITAWHLVQDATAVTARFSDGETVKVCGWVDFDEERDLAIVKLENPAKNKAAALHFSIESVASRVYAIGTPKGSPFSITDGLISQMRNDGFDQYQVSCPISPGNSGGPIINRNGQVIGIISWTKTDAQNMSFAIPIREIGHLNTSKKMTPWSRNVATPSLTTSSGSPESAPPVSGQLTRSPVDPD